MKPIYDFNAFDTLAGSTFWEDAEETTSELITALAEYDPDQAATLRAEFEALDPEHEDTPQMWSDMADEIIDRLNDLATLPPACTITWHDGEVIVEPFVDDDAPSIEAGAPVFYAVNDHGNVTCYAATDDGYRVAWEMV